MVGTYRMFVFLHWIFLMIFFPNHLEDVNKQIDHIVVQSNGTKDVILFTHLVLGVFAAVEKKIDNVRECMP